MNGGELYDFLKKCNTDTRGCNSWGNYEGWMDLGLICGCDRLRS